MKFLLVLTWKHQALQVSLKVIQKESSCFYNKIYRLCDDLCDVKLATACTFEAPGCSTVPRQPRSIRVLSVYF